MKPAFCVLALLCLFSVTVQGQKEKEKPRQMRSPSYFYKAEMFLEVNEVSRETYTTGLMDGFYASGMFGASDETVDSLDSCTKGMDSKQLAAIIEKYVKDHPEGWHHPLSVQAFNALNGACPGQLKTP
jgi:hypothetical protein